MRLTKRRQATSTVIGIGLLAVMLFPVYWMINTSLQSGNVGASSTLLPLHPTLAAYRLALSQQGGDIVTSLTISCGTVLCPWPSRRRPPMSWRSRESAAVASSCSRWSSPRWFPAS